MDNPVAIMCMIAASVAVVGVLGLGLFAMAKGGDGGRRSNRLMRWRIALQAAALVLFLIAVAAAS